MDPWLGIVALIFAALAALLHVYIWIMESILWTRPSIWKRFGLKSQADAETTKPLALNQGFYNLFLAIGVFVGLALLGAGGHASDALIFLSCGSMLAASLVLVISNPKMIRAAATQGLFPLIAIVCGVIFELTTKVAIPV